MTSFKLADPQPSSAWARDAIRTHPCRHYWLTENFNSLCNRTKAGIQGTDRFNDRKATGWTFQPWLDAFLPMSRLPYHFGRLSG